MASSSTGDLAVGEYVEYEGRAWRVGLVNFSRARLDPVKQPSAAALAKDPFAGSVNVGPSSTLRRLASDEAATYHKPKESEMSEENTDEVAGMPVPAKKDRLKRGASKARKATGSKATASKPRKVKKEAAVADKPCKCGCGGKTASHFIAGHDARFKGWLLKIERGQAKKEDLLKKAVIGAYTWKKKGKGEVPTTDYKGRPHKGYESTSEA